MADYKTGASIIIPCHNSERTIEKLILALLRQDGAGDLPCEIILVDNNSTDGTVRLVEKTIECMPKRFPLQVVVCSRQGAGRARQVAFSRVKYGVTIFLDDDNEPAPDWISRACQIFERHPSVGAVGGFNEPVTDGTLPPWFLDFQSSYACGAQGRPGYATNRGYLFGAGCALRSAMLKEIYSNQPQMVLSGSMAGVMSSGSDSELCARVMLMDYELFYDEKLRLNHHIRSDRLNWPYVIAKREASGASDVVLAVYRDFIFRRRPYEYELTVKYARRHERRLYERVTDDENSEGNQAFASWRYADAKLQAFERLGAVRWNRMVNGLASVFLKKGYDTILPADTPEPECTGWEDLMGKNPAPFGSCIELQRIGHAYDTRGNLHLCLEGSKIVRSSLEYIVLTTVDVGGGNVFWRKVSGVDRQQPKERFRLKMIVEKSKVEASHYVGIRLGTHACTDRTRLIDQQGQRLLIELPTRGG
jgi:glycosyltransferase involved in cell wall biosynthesis